MSRGSACSISLTSGVSSGTSEVLRVSYREASPEDGVNIEMAEGQQNTEYDMMQVEASRISPTPQKFDFDSVKLLIETKDNLDSLQEHVAYGLCCIQFCGLELCIQFNAPCCNIIQELERPLLDPLSNQE
ncbi:hypothetical protein CU097_007593 [Rhizopus azygosporus]|uniref:Uncharacterized protein n=1 Tax=Rhizopus azygosporus TaxID=86630 RepID=A0A367J7K5_RHIAZ|nr:hypothetical protein CU097_007593 [Rhizopus azygosporus]